jgi:hypothetical protein
LENGRFSFFAVIFCTVLLCTVFQTFRSGNRFVFKRFVPEIAPFSCKTYQICHCEEGAVLAPDAAIFDGTICHPGTNYGCAERNRTLKESESKRNEAANPLFCNRAFFLFRAPVLRHGMPRRSLKDCHVAALLAMTQNWNVFVWKTDVFCFMRSFFARCCSAPFSNVSFRKLLRFPAKPTRFVIARRAQF